MYSQVDDYIKFGYQQAIHILHFITSTKSVIGICFSMALKNLFLVSVICVVQKCYIDSAQDKPVSPQLEAYSSRILHFNLRQRKTFQKARALLAFHKKVIHGSDIFMLGTNVTRIVFCNPISNVPKSKGLTSTTTHSASWCRHPLCLVLMLLGFFVIPFQIFPKEEGLTSTTTHSPRSYKKVVSWFRTPFYALVLMLLGFGLSRSKRCLTGTTTHSIRKWFHGFRHLFML